MTLATDQEWPRAAVLNIVGLCGRHLGEHTPHISAFANRNQAGCQVIDPVLWRVTQRLIQRQIINRSSHLKSGKPGWDAPVYK